MRNKVEEEGMCVCVRSERGDANVNEARKMTLRGVDEYSKASLNIISVFVEKEHYKWDQEMFWSSEK
jgi:hypothetical protein